MDVSSKAFRRERVFTLPISREQPVIPDALLDQLLAGADAKTAFDKDGLLDELKKALAERALNAEIDHHLETGDGDGKPHHP